MNRRQSANAGTATQARDAGDNARSAVGNSGEYAYGKQCDETERNDESEMEEFPKNTIYDDESKGETSNEVRRSGSSVDSWDKADDLGRMEYEMHMDDEDGWNMGLRSLKSHESEDGRVISDEYRGLVNTLEKEEHELCMTGERNWHQRISTVHQADNDEDQVSIEIKKMKKKSWWENINNWFVKKINPNQRQERNELHSKKEEEIIFIEDSDLPIHDGTCEKNELQGKAEWRNAMRMEGLEMSPQIMHESLIYDSFGNPSESESDITIGTQENNMDLDGYIRMKKMRNQRDERRC